MNKPYLNEKDEWCIEVNGVEIVFVSYEEAYEYYEAHLNE